MAQYPIETSAFTRFFIADTGSSWLWLIIRVYLGYEWLSAGWEKFINPAWIGPQAGTALNGFIQGALAKTAGAHPDVQGWYAWFLTHAVLPHVVTWSYFVVAGEMLVGIALLFGFLTGLSVFFGMFMNLNFMLSGSVSVNPIWFVLSLGIILAWRVSGHIGLDRYVLPFLHKSLRRRSVS